MSRSLTVAPRENILSYSGDVGAPITRRRYTSRLIDYSAQLFLTEALRLSLDNFHHDDCEDGSLPFTMNDWIGGDDHTFKWVSPPQFTQAGPSGHWIANVSFVRIA